MLISKLYAELHNTQKAYQYLKLYNTLRDERDSKGEIGRVADFEMQSLLTRHERKIDVLEKNNMLVETKSKQQIQQKNFAFASIAIILLGGGYSFYRFRKRKKLQSHC